MSWRGRHRADQNQNPLARAAEKIGWSAQTTSGVGHGFPDLVLGNWGRNLIVEVKAIGESLRSTQREFRQRWRGQYAVVQTEADLVDLLTKPHNPGAITYAIERALSRLDRVDNDDRRRVILRDMATDIYKAVT